MSVCVIGLPERVDTALAECPHVRAGQVSSKTEQQRVLLTGRVNSYFAKQMVQETVRRLDGVQQIDNQLEVHWL
jgi:osmotically-inducible protein OsmY